MSLSAYFRKNGLVFCFMLGGSLWKHHLPKLSCGPALSLIHPGDGLGPSQKYFINISVLTVLFPMSKTIPCATCGVPRAMSHCLEGEATSPGAQHQSIPVKGSRADQHSTGDGKYSQMGEHSLK